LPSIAPVSFRRDARFNIFAGEFFMARIFQNWHCYGLINLNANKYTQIFAKVNRPWNYGRKKLQN